jgi:hypothetical protein
MAIQYGFGPRMAAVAAAVPEAIFQEIKRNCGGKKIFKSTPARLRLGGFLMVAIMGDTIDLFENVIVLRMGVQVVMESSDEVGNHP